MSVLEYRIVSTKGFCCVNLGHSKNFLLFGRAWSLLPKGSLQIYESKKKILTTSQQTKLLHLRYKVDS